MDNEIISYEGGVMSDEELARAFEWLDNEIFGPHRPMGPLPREEVARREKLLMLQVHLAEIADAKGKNRRDLGLFHTEMYRVIRAFWESHV